MGFTEKSDRKGHKKSIYIGKNGNLESLPKGGCLAKKEGRRGGGVFERGRGGTPNI